MPTYDYVCDACAHAFEHFQGISEPRLLKCPACGRRKLRRLIGTGAGVVFKGSGFYETDYKRAAPAGKTDAPAAKDAATPAGDGGDSRKPKDGKESAESGAPKGPRDSKDSRDSQGPQDPKASKDTPRGAAGDRDAPTPERSPPAAASRDARESRADGKDGRNGKGASGEASRGADKPVSKAPRPDRKSP